MFSSKISNTISKLDQEFRKIEIKKSYNLLVLSPTLGKARPRPSSKHTTQNKKEYQ